MSVRWKGWQRWWLVCTLLLVPGPAAAQIVLEYPPEIFDYCVHRYGHGRQASNCMSNEEARRVRLMRELREALGRQSAARALYADCVDIFSDRGIYPIESCLRARIAAIGITGSARVARIIYDGCLRTWGRTGSNVAAAERCTKADARWYKDHGKLKKR